MKYCLQQSRRRIRQGCFVKQDLWKSLCPNRYEDEGLVLLLKLIPNNYEYEDSSTIPSYISMDGDFKLEQGTPLRVKLTGVRINANEIVCLFILCCVL